jgi:hypothetical protein
VGRENNNVHHVKNQLLRRDPISKNLAEMKLPDVLMEHLLADPTPRPTAAVSKAILAFVKANIDRLPPPAQEMCCAFSAEVSLVSSS